jgi:plasmid stabilization system protein ParE
MKVVVTDEAAADLDAIADWIGRDNPRRALIFSRISDDRIEVLHVLHGARDYESILFPEG